MGTGDYPISIKMCFRKSPLYRAIELWNTLHPSWRLNHSWSAFKGEALVTIRKICDAKRKGLTQGQLE